jgi:hypothetical protein
MSQPRRRLAIIAPLLLVVLARALVPSGFMPASDGSAQLTLCPDGMLMPSDAALANAGHLHADHCPFGAAPFAAPISAPPVIPQLAAAVGSARFAPSPWPSAGRTARSHQPRAPPA